MANIKGKKIRVEIAKTYGAPIAVSEVTNAKPGVATATAHGLQNNSCGYFATASGMPRLVGQACRVKNKTDDTFELQGLNTTNMGAFNTGTFIPVTEWETLAEATSHGSGSGSATKLDATTLLDEDQVEEQGLGAAKTANIAVLSQDVPSAAAEIIEDADQASELVLVRVTLATGAVRLYRGEASQPGEDIQKGQLATGTMDITVKGRILKLAA